MSKVQVELPDGRIIIVDQSNPEEVAAVRAKILKDFPDAANPTPDPEQGGRERAMEARMEAQRRKGQGPLQSGIENFGRGLGRIVSGDVSPREYGEALETSVRSMTGPVGGDYLAAGGENIANFVTGQPNNPAALDEQRARREELATRSPLQAGASEILGFGGVQKAVTGAVPALATTTGSTVARTNRLGNALKVSGDAALTTAIGEGAQGSDLDDTLATSGIAAVMAPPLSAAMRGVVQGVTGAPSGVRSVASEAVDTGGVSQAALRALAQRSNLTPEELVERVADYKRKNNGNTPRLAEIVDERSIDQFKALTDRRPAAGQVLDAAEEAAARERPVQMRETLSEGQRPQSPEALRRKRDNQMTQTLRTKGPDGAPSLEEQAVDAKPFIAIFEENQELYGGLDPTIRRRFARATNAEDGSAPEPFTIGLAEDIRRSLRKRSKALDGWEFGAGAIAVEDIAAAASKPYADALETYRRQSQFVDGVERGRTTLSARQEDFEANIPDLSPAERLGASRGARGEIATRAGESASGALRVARALQEPGTQARVASAVGPGAAQRFADTGETQIRGAMNMARLSPRTELPPSLAAASGDLAEIAAAASGRAGSQLIARVIENTAEQFRGLGVPPNAAANMARLLTDPNRTDDVVRKLVEVGISEDNVQRAIQQFGTALAATMAGPTDETLFYRAEDAQ